MKTDKKNQEELKETKKKITHESQNCKIQSRISLKKLMEVDLKFEDEINKYRKVNLFKYYNRLTPDFRVKILKERGTKI